MTLDWTHGVAVSLPALVWAIVQGFRRAGFKFSFGNGKSAEPVDNEKRFLTVLDKLESIATDAHDAARDAAAARERSVQLFSAVNEATSELRLLREQMRK